MKRFVNWLLGGLAVGAVASALLRRDPVPATDVEPVHWGGHPVPAEPAPPAGVDRWRFLGRELAQRFKENHTGIIAGSLAYYAMLAIFPTLIAAVAIYGLVTNPADLERQITSVVDALPSDAASLITTQLETIVSGSGAGLGLAAAISILIALWSSSAGTKALISGINIAYGLPETRSFFRLRGLAIVLTLGAVIFVGFITWFIGLVSVSAGSVAQESLLALGVLVSLVVSLGVLYKLAPDRPTRIGKILSPGAIAATALLVLTTTGFTLYVTSFGAFGATYGALAGVIVLLLWFFISGFVVLLGAELNAELELLRDT